MQSQELALSIWWVMFQKRKPKKGQKCKEPDLEFGVLIDSLKNMKFVVPER